MTKYVLQVSSQTGHQLAWIFTESQFPDVLELIKLAWLGGHLTMDEMVFVGASLCGHMPPQETNVDIGK